MEIKGYVACITEGAAEKAIIDLLLDNHVLCFDRSDLLDEEIITCRNARVFEGRYLRKSFSKDITVIRVLDSRREVFKLSKAYKGKVSVINVITAPEIEMLIILSENKYDHYKKLNMKPSEYCKAVLKYKNVKSYDFVKNYFSDIGTLLNAIERYAKVTKPRKGEYTLKDICI